MGTSNKASRLEKVGEKVPLSREIPLKNFLGFSVDSF